MERERVDAKTPVYWIDDRRRVRARVQNANIFKTLFFVILFDILVFLPIELTVIMPQFDKHTKIMCA